MGGSKGGPVYRGLGKIPDRVLFLFAGLVYLFLYAPIMVLIFFSFNSTKNTQVWTGFSMQWYGDLIRDSSVLNAFKLSLMVGLTATAIATIIGTLTALALSRYDFRGKTFADSAIYAATVMPEIVVGVSLLVFFVAAGLQLGITSIIIAHVAFTISFDDFVITFFVAGVGSSTLPLKIYSMIRFGLSPAINALSTVVLVVTMILIFGGSRIFMKKENA